MASLTASVANGVPSYLAIDPFSCTVRVVHHINLSFINAHAISGRPLVDPQLQFYHRKNSGSISPRNGILSTGFSNFSSNPSTTFANSLYAKVIARYFLAISVGENRKAVYYGSTPSSSISSKTTGRHPMETLNTAFISPKEVTIT